MNIKVRAAIAVGLLAGFFAGGWALVVLGAAVSVRLWSGGPVSVTAGALSALATACLAVAIGTVTVAGLRAGRTPPQGIELPEHRAPALWEQVRSTASAVGVREPDRIWLVADADISVRESPARLGLMPGARSLVVGAPLLAALDVGGLRAVVAQEFGYHSGAGTPLGGVTCRGYAAIRRTIEVLGAGSAAGWVLRRGLAGYATLSLPVRQQQEFAADRVMARVVGVTTAIRVLVLRPAIVAAWRRYLDNNVGYGWHLGYAPVGVTGSFGALFTTTGGELDDLPGLVADGPRPPPEERPPSADRIAALERLRHADGSEVVVGDPGLAPARVLVPGAESLFDQLDEARFDLRGRTVLPFDQYVSTVATAEAQRAADLLYRAAAQVTGLPQSGLADVLDLLAAGRLSDLAAVVADADWSDNVARKQAVNLLADLLNAAIAATAVRSGAATWRHTWVHPPRLVDLDGEPLRLGDLVWRAILEQGAVRGVSAELARHGIDERAGRVEDPRQRPAVAPVAPR